MAPNQYGDFKPDRSAAADYSGTGKGARTGRGGDAGHLSVGAAREGADGTGGATATGGGHATPVAASGRQRSYFQLRRSARRIAHRRPASISQRPAADRIGRPGS